MPLKLVQSQCSTTLFDACADRFLAQTGAGPGGHVAVLWRPDCIQRDALYERAIARGLRGWLNPPVQFLSALPQLFDIKGNAIGTLTRRERSARLGSKHGERHGIRMGNRDATITRGQMLDGFIGELLPEGIPPEALKQSLDAIKTDAFGARRNAWLTDVYTAYLAALAERTQYDPRSVHAMVAERVDAGVLRKAIGGSASLHIYGLYSARARQKLLASFASQPDVDVIVYTTTGATDLVRFASSVEVLPSSSAAPLVQPAPDANREMQWVAVQVKRLIVEQGVRAHDIAVVARTGQQDTRRAMQALEREGVPATARVRTRLSEVAALKAILELFRGPAQDWSYRILRNLLASPYFRFRIDLRPFDSIACQARPISLAEWEGHIAELIARLKAAEDPDARRLGLRHERVEKDLVRFRGLREALEPLDGDKTLGQWIALTRTFLTARDYHFRHRVCNAPDSRHDVVRIDQRGVRRFEALLTEWAASDDKTEVLSPGAWFRSLRALLDGQELVLTTPGQKGVQVLEAHDAALAPLRAVFLVHANDGEFPKSSAPGGLFSQEERAQLHAGGLPLDDRRSMLQRERVLWSAVCAAPAVTVTYRTTEPNGTPLLPSLLVPAHDPASELPRSFAQAQGVGAGLATLDVAGLRRAILSAYAETRRGAPERVAASVNPWNGQVRDPFVLDWLTTRYNDDTYVWSVSQLQTYTTCPFFFLIERVLGLKAIEEADEDTNALASGGVAHEVLERYYSELIGQASPPFDQQHFIDLAARVFREWESGGEWLGIRSLWEQRRLHLTQILCNFVEWDLDKHLSKGQSVFACEYEIGHDGEGVELHGQDVHGARAQLRLRGFIDRIDRTKKGDLEVIDYKSGRMPSGKDGYADGAVLQGPVYMHALRAQDHAASKAMYRSLKDKGNGAPLKFDDPHFSMALAIAFTVPQRVRAGLFESILASSAKTWSSWHPDLSIRRTDAIAEGSRFDDAG